MLEERRRKAVRGGRKRYQVIVVGQEEVRKIPPERRQADQDDAGRAHDIGRRDLCRCVTRYVVSFHPAEKGQGCRESKDTLQVERAIDLREKAEWTEEGSRGNQGPGGGRDGDQNE